MGMGRLVRTIGEIANVNVTKTGKTIDLLIPGWDSHVTVTVQFDDLPGDIQERLNKEVPILVLVKVDLSTDDVNFLNPTDFELAPQIVVDSTPSNFLESCRRINLDGTVQYRDSAGEVQTFVGEFSLWENGGIALSHNGRTEDVLPEQVKTVVGSGIHEYKPVTLYWLPEEQSFCVMTDRQGREERIQ